MSAVCRSAQLLEADPGSGPARRPVLAPGICWTIHRSSKPLSCATGRRSTSGHPVYGDASPAPPGKDVRREAPSPLNGVRLVDFGTYVAGPIRPRSCRSWGRRRKVSSLPAIPSPRLPLIPRPSIRGKRPDLVDRPQAAGGPEIDQKLVRRRRRRPTTIPAWSSRQGSASTLRRCTRPVSIPDRARKCGLWEHGPRAEGAGFDMCSRPLRS